jgi:hypothetical protein
MESWGLFEVARGVGIAFQVLRMITDSPEQPLPRALGSWARRRVLRGLGQAAAEPMELARFLARAAGFPAKLAEGWRGVAEAWRE